MTPEEKRIKIAEACGWKVDRDKGENGAYWFQIEDLPDYLNDLNAMNEAEKRLSYNQRNKYLNALHLITYIEENDQVDDDFAWCVATASQRAESFLKTLNLWKL